MPDFTDSLKALGERGDPVGADELIGRIEDGRRRSGRRHGMMAFSRFGLAFAAVIGAGLLVWALVPGGSVPPGSEGLVPPTNATTTTVLRSAPATDLLTAPWSWSRADGTPTDTPTGPFASDADGLLAVLDGDVVRSDDGLAWDPVTDGGPIDGQPAWMILRDGDLWIGTNSGRGPVLWDVSGDVATSHAVEANGWSGAPVSLDGVDVVPVDGPVRMSVLAGELSGQLDPVDVPWDDMFVKVVAGEQTFIAYTWGGSGEPASSARSWTSVDGRTWTAGPTPFAGEPVSWLSVGGSGPFMAETVWSDEVRDHASGWMSDDGLEWRPAGIESADGTGSVLEFDSGLAFFSFDYSQEGDHVALWISADGDTWRDVSDRDVMYPTEAEAGELGWWMAGDRAVVVRTYASGERTAWVGGFEESS